MKDWRERMRRSWSCGALLAIQPLNQPALRRSQRRSMALRSADRGGRYSGWKWCQWSDLVLCQEASSSEDGAASGDGRIFRRQTVEEGLEGLGVAKRLTFSINYFFL